MSKVQAILADTFGQRIHGPPGGGPAPPPAKLPLYYNVSGAGSAQWNGQYMRRVSAVIFFFLFCVCCWCWCCAVAVAAGVEEHPRSPSPSSTRLGVVAVVVLLLTRQVPQRVASSVVIIIIIVVVVVVVVVLFVVVVVVVIIVVIIMISLSRPAPHQHKQAHGCAIRRVQVHHLRHLRPLRRGRHLAPGRHRHGPGLRRGCGTYGVDL